MREAVSNEAKLSSLHILFYRVEELFFRDLVNYRVSPGGFEPGRVEVGSVCRWQPYLELGIGPSGDLNDHVQHHLLLIGIQGDIMKW